MFFREIERISTNRSPVAFKVLDIQDSGEILVLEDKGSEMNASGINETEYEMDYSAVVTHPLYKKVQNGDQSTENLVVSLFSYAPSSLDSQSCDTADFDFRVSGSVTDGKNTESHQYHMEGQLRTT